MTKPFLRTVFACLMMSALLAQPVLAFGLRTSESAAILPSGSRPVQIQYSGLENNGLTINPLLSQLSNIDAGTTKTVATAPPKSNETLVTGKVKKIIKRALLANRRNRTLAHHGSRTMLAVDDCDSCHQGCLAASLTCIAISIVTGCLPCGVICLAGQVACQVICNGTRACTQVAPVESAN
jgi:hypothetical protein